MNLDKLEDLPSSEIYKEANFQPPLEPSKIEEVLASYGAQTKVLDFWIGPSVTTYEVKLPAGFKLEHLIRSQGDIARDLQCQSLRILSSIKGSANIGIEIENPKRFSINFKSLLKGLPKDMKIPIVLGEDTFGEPVYTDLTTLPHLLIAGTTGSGKSVFLNSIILTILATQKPSDVRLVMIDPKVVEFLDYKDVHHLLKPITSDADESVKMLYEVVEIMEDRFRLLSTVKGAKNISDYNEATGEHLPYIVFIIDEYADLITGSNRTERNAIEQCLKRIAQKARAVGIHMIAATQKPNREVVTPLLKANLPARVAFSVTSGTDSRVILDCMGAERLAGKGDMLFKDPTARNEHMGLRRVQSPFVSRNDIEAILNG
jgi:S-DNA-T family DNA segregation ATPase FtsK/SpoIIIE